MGNFFEHDTKQCRHRQCDQHVRQQYRHNSPKGEVGKGSVRDGSTHEVGMRMVAKRPAKRYHRMSNADCCRI